MSISSQLQAIQFYTAADPYYYTVDNRPLQNLSANQTAIAAYVDKTHPGRVDVTGGTSPVTNAIPAGWTVTRSGTGVYVITHNLNTTAYSVTGSLYSAGAFFVTALTATTFTANTVNLSGAAVDVQFACNLTLV